MNNLAYTVCCTITALLLAQEASAFSVSTPTATNRIKEGTTNPSESTTSYDLLQRPLHGRHFQLEELEGSESSTTEVLLNADLSVSIGETDGPRYTAARGTWEEGYHYSHRTAERLFSMTLTKRFVTGTDRGQDTNDIGEFEYEVERTYSGECFTVGGTLIAMQGQILDIDSVFGERRVGFFNMIDTTDERDGLNLTAVEEGS